MIEMEDIKLWIGELVIENRLLQKELIRLKQQFEQIKTEMLNDSISVQKEEKTETETD